MQAKHVPGYLEKAEEFKAAGVDEIWCLRVNDAFVMALSALHRLRGMSRVRV